MLRDFVTHPDARLISDVLAMFAIDSTADRDRYTLLAFTVITPDSFAWKLLIDDKVYYLYAEDHLQSFTEVQSGIAAASGRNDIVLTLVPTKEQCALSKSAPSVSASSDINSGLMDYSVSSGYDHVFLCRTDIPATDAYFID